MKLPQVGDIVVGVVAKVYHNYAIMVFEDDYTGLLHISELSNRFIRSFTGYCKVGNVYTVKVIAVDQERMNVKVSLKQMNSLERRQTLKGEMVPEGKIDATKLLEKLPDWIEKAIEQEEKERENL